MHARHLNVSSRFIGNCDEIIEKKKKNENSLPYSFKSDYQQVL